MNAREELARLERLSRAMHRPRGQKAQPQPAERNGWRSPAGDGRHYPDWTRKLKFRSGVYLIKDAASGELLYAGESHTGKLYETLTRHFQSWAGPTASPTYNRHHVLVKVRVMKPALAQRAQFATIRRWKPRDNDLECETTECRTKYYLRAALAKKSRSVPF